ncbi:MAG: hypothetical protein M3N53_00210 [Actinomycetota bacterium]|nr:hypothetical protein [Actinomycetota bacterium]
MPIKTVVLSMATLLVVAPAAGSAVPIGSREACTDVSLPLRNFKIEASWQTPSVSVGDVAKLKVLVTRTADEDPVTDDGVPYPTGRPMNEPAEGVSLGLGFLVGDTFLTAGGLTDANGRAVVKVRIESYARPGTGESTVYGQRNLTPPDFPSPQCRVVIYEWGRLAPGPTLKVVR